MAPDDGLPPQMGPPEAPSRAVDRQAAAPEPVIACAAAPPTTDNDSGGQPAPVLITSASRAKRRPILLKTPDAEPAAAAAAVVATTNPSGRSARAGAGGRLAQILQAEGDTGSQSDATPAPSDLSASEDNAQEEEQQRDRRRSARSARGKRARGGRRQSTGTAAAAQKKSTRQRKTAESSEEEEVEAAEPGQGNNRSGGSSSSSDDDNGSSDREVSPVAAKRPVRASAAAACVAWGQRPGKQGRAAQGAAGAAPGKRRCGQQARWGGGGDSGSSPESGEDDEVARSSQDEEDPSSSSEEEEEQEEEEEEQPRPKRQQRGRGHAQQQHRKRGAQSRKQQQQEDNASEEDGSSKGQDSDTEDAAAVPEDDADDDEAEGSEEDQPPPAPSKPQPAECMPGCELCGFARAGCEECAARPVVRRPAARWRAGGGRSQASTPAAPVYRPTAEEFRDPIAFIQRSVFARHAGLFGLLDGWRVHNPQLVASASERSHPQHHPTRTLPFNAPSPFLSTPGFTLKPPSTGSARSSPPAFAASLPTLLAWTAPLPTPSASRPSVRSQTSWATCRACVNLQQPLISSSSSHCGRSRRTLTGRSPRISSAPQRSTSKQTPTPAAHPSGAAASRRRRAQRAAGAAGLRNEGWRVGAHQTAATRMRRATPAAAGGAAAKRLRSGRPRAHAASHGKLRKKGMRAPQRGQSSLSFGALWRLLALEPKWRCSAGSGPSQISQRRPAAAAPPTPGTWATCRATGATCCVNCLVTPVSLARGWRWGRASRRRGGGWRRVGCTRSATCTLERPGCGTGGWVLRRGGCGW